MHRLLIAMALLFVAPLATAQVYKWTDAGGTVHYAQQPPAEGTKYQLVKTTGTAEPRVAAAPGSPAGENTEPMSESTAPVADTPENRSKLCESLKANLAALQGSGPVVMQQNGKPTALDAEQRKQQTSTAQTQYQQYCQSQQ